MATNGEEGLKLVQDIKPDLILSDVMMPIMDGFELHVNNSKRRDKLYSDYTSYGKNK